MQVTAVVDGVFSDFSLAAQVFSMLAVLCYAVSFLLFLAYIVFHSLGRSRTLTMSLCLLAFSIGQWLWLLLFLLLLSLSSLLFVVVVVVVVVMTMIVQYRFIC